MTLTEFLLARIAEDEESARNTRWLALEYGVDSYGREAFSARVLAEVEAKRRIVENCAGMEYQGPSAAGLADIVLTELARVYADHPDYRDEWRV